MYAAVLSERFVSALILSTTLNEFDLCLIPPTEHYVLLSFKRLKIMMMLLFKRLNHFLNLIIRLQKSSRVLNYHAKLR